MPKWRYLLILALAFLLSACASHYRVTTYEGKVYDTKGKPHFDEEAKTYSFKERGDGQVILNQRDIKEIKQIDD
ncbi:MAG: YgdI/YgdR family lipoprotein [Pseudomonadota bacterium]